MAGHSKWANIKHRKESVDAKRSKEFQKLTNEFRVVAKAGTDPRTNAGLRTLLNKARAINMPKALIEKAIQQASAPGNTGETFWIAGNFHKQLVAIIQVQTDRKSFTLNIIKKFFQKTKFDLLPVNSMVHLFTYVLAFHLQKLTEDQILILMEQFSPFETKIFNSESETEEIIFYFDDSHQAKKFHDYVTEKEYQLTENYQTYLPLLTHRDLSDELFEEWTTLKETLLTKDYCLQVIDDWTK